MHPGKCVNVYSVSFPLPSFVSRLSLLLPIEGSPTRDMMHALYCCLHTVPILFQCSHGFTPTTKSVGVRCKPHSFDESLDNDVAPALVVVIVALCCRVVPQLQVHMAPNLCDVPCNDFPHDASTPCSPFHE